MSGLHREFNKVPARLPPPPSICNKVECVHCFHACDAFQYNLKHSADIFVPNPDSMSPCLSCLIWAAVVMRLRILLQQLRNGV